MRLYTSYFYQIRFFEPNMIPISTAIWDPKWFHDFQGARHIYVDKRGVINGVRAEALRPGPGLEGTCAGREGHAPWCEHDPSKCSFLRGYMAQLIKLDCNDYARRLENLGIKLKRLAGFRGEPVIVLIVYESPSNPCSERATLQRWFSMYGHEISEWKRN